MLSTSPQPICL